jgi:hypothetical protein
MHPGQLEALAKAHTDELRRRPARLLPARRPRRRSVRGTTGWFLVNLGLRLAVRRPSVPAATR